MTESILKNETVIRSLLLKPRYEKYRHLILLPNEIRGLENLLNFLLPFRALTDKLQAEKWPTLSLLWPAIVSLRKKCEPSSPEDLFQAEQSDDEAEFGGEDDANYTKATEDLKAAVLSAINNKFRIDRKPIDSTAKEKEKKEEMKDEISRKICILATSLDLRFRGFLYNFKTPVIIL